MNMILYAILAVFICGLMVGRTPEYLGKKIEGREMKLTALAIIIHPLLILAFSALAVSCLLYTSPLRACYSAVPTERPPSRPGRAQRGPERPRTAPPERTAPRRFGSAHRGPDGQTAVSYTHLDVYKRQPLFLF